MGQDVCQDWVITLSTMHALINLLDKEWLAAPDFATKELVCSI
jgi:hypothetical protein